MILIMLSLFFVGSTDVEVVAKLYRAMEEEGKEERKYPKRPRDGSSGSSITSKRPIIPSSLNVSLSSDSDTLPP